jgi:hypothetical protein
MRYHFIDGKRTRLYVYSFTQQWKRKLSTFLTPFVDMFGHVPGLISKTLTMRCLIAIVYKF